MKTSFFSIIAMLSTYSTQLLRSVGAIPVMENPLSLGALAPFSGGCHMAPKYTITHNAHGKGYLLTIHNADGSKVLIPCHNRATAADIGRNSKKPAYASMIASFKKS